MFRNRLNRECQLIEGDYSMELQASNRRSIWPLLVISAFLILPNICNAGDAWSKIYSVENAYDSRGELLPSGGVCLSRFYFGEISALMGPKEDQVTIKANARSALQQVNPQYKIVSGYLFCACLKSMPCSDCKGTGRVWVEG